MAAQKKQVTPKINTSAVAQAAISQMSAAEIGEINKLVRYAVQERNFPKFKAGLLRLGYDENSAEYEALVRLWDECLRVSRP